MKIEIEHCPNGFAVWLSDGTNTIGLGMGRTLAEALALATEQLETLRRDVLNELLRLGKAPKRKR